MTTSNVSVESPSGVGGFPGKLVLTVVLANLLVFALAALSLSQSQRQYQERAEITANNLTQALENHLAGIFDKVDIALLATVDHAESFYAGRLDGAGLNAALARQQARLPELDSLRVCDEHGLVSFGPGIPAGKKVDISDRPHFIRVRDDAHAGLVIGKPIFARINQKWVLPIARRVNHRDGTFAGMAYAFIPLENFHKSFATLNVGARGIVTLRDNSLGIVVRHPEPKGIGSVIGQTAAPQPLQEMLKAGRNAGTYLSLSTVDGVERTFSYRRIGNYPFLIIVGLASDDYFAEWRSDAAKLLLLAGLFLLGSLIGATLIYRTGKHRLAAANALRESEYRLNQLFENMSSGVAIYRPIAGGQDFVFSALNQAVERIEKVRRADLIGKKVTEIFPVAQESGLIEVFKRVLASGEAESFPLSSFCDGQMTMWRENYVYRLPGGEIVAIYDDVTERKQAEEALLEQEKRFRAYFERSMVGMATTSPTKGWLDVNDALCATLGYPREELVRMTWAELTFPEDLAPDVAQFNRLLSGEIDGYAMDKRFIHKDGHLVYTRMAVRGVRKGDAVDYLVALVEDISERKLAEIRLRELNENLEQRVEVEVQKNMAQERLLIQQSRLAAMGEMVHNIAHQWRQPLNALGLLQANIQDAFEFGELTRENMARFAEIGQHLIQKMSSTIDDFRNFFRPNQEKTEFSLQQGVERALNIINANFHHDNIAVACCSGADIHVIGFANEFSQVLLNVLNNARDAILDKQMPDGKIDIELGQDGPNAFIVIRDNGGGIPAELLPKIFDPYFTTKDKGSGIGLYMSRMIMEHMDGFISATNTTDGAEFRLALPKAGGATAA